MATLIEGVESITLWCSLAVLAPAILLTLIAQGGHGWLVGGSIAGSATMTWARAGRLWDWRTDGLVHWLLGVVIIATVVGVFRARHPTSALSLAFGTISGLIAGWLWQPCVGEELAELLNRAEGDRASTLLGLNVYLTGLMVPAVILAAAPRAWPVADRFLAHWSVRRGALLLAIVYGVAVAAGWYDDLVSELLRLSSN